MKTQHSNSKSQASSCGVQVLHVAPDGETGISVSGLAKVGWWPDIIQQINGLHGGTNCGIAKWIEPFSQWAFLLSEGTDQAKVVGSKVAAGGHCLLRL